MTDPRTPPALSNATPRQFADNLRKVAIRGGGLGEGRLCLVCFAASHFDPHTSTDTLEHEPCCPVAAAPPVAEGPAATPSLELISAKVHEAWISEKRARGFHHMSECEKRKRTITEEFQKRYPTLAGCDFCHADLIPYDQLTEDKKELDRATVRTVLGAMQQAGAAPSGVSQPPCEHKWEPLYNGDGGVVFSQCSKCKATACQAAEPPDARAAAHEKLANELSWKYELGRVGYRALLEGINRAAADLQRQLDEARRERNEALNRTTQFIVTGGPVMMAADFERVKRDRDKAESAVEDANQHVEQLCGDIRAIQQDYQEALDGKRSAEAANQELRTTLQKIVTLLEEAGIDDIAVCDELYKIAGAALLGPQHGDTK